MKTIVNGKIKTLILFSALGLFVTVKPVHSISTCFQSTGFDFADSINNSLDYLICLHNEQNRSLNSHADLLNQHAEFSNETRRLFADIIDSQNSKINDLEYELQRLKREIVNLQN